MANLRAVGLWLGFDTSERHAITTYLWLTGAVTVKHFSRFYVFLVGALYNARWKLWARIIRLAAQLPERQLRVLGDGGLRHQGMPAMVTGRGQRGLPHAHHRQAL